MANPRQLAVFALGMIAFVVWTATFAIAFNWAWQFAGSPNPPTRVWFQSMNIGLSSVLGGACGSIVPLMARRDFMAYWFLFAVGATLALVLAAFIYADGASTVRGQFTNFGTWGFLSGSAIGAMLGSKITRRNA